MDTLRGQFGSFEDDAGEGAYDPAGDGEDFVSEAPPSPVGQDERRMQVRAYNHWASLLADRNFPSIEDLDPAALPDFGPYSVLLDFTGGIDNPAVQFLGEELARECGTEGPISTLGDVPSRSLLSRITDHYMQILANQAPIGFEAEFVNQRSVTILYRGILLPFSSDDDTIDFIYGVINWKEVADQLTSDELLLEIDQALEADSSTPDGVSAPAHAAETAGLAIDTDGGNDGGNDGWENGWDDDGGHEDEGMMAEFVLPDIGEADEEDTINHEAYASLMPSDEDDGDLGLAGLGGLRSKPAKKPLDLSITQALTPPDGTEDPDPSEEADDFPSPAFGQEDGRFASLLGSGFDDDEVGDGDEDSDDWSSAFGREDANSPAEPGSLPEDAQDRIPAADDTGFQSDEGDTPTVAEFAAPQPAPAQDDAALPGIPGDDAEPAAAVEPVVSSADRETGPVGLFDILAEARELALIASTREDRSRAALYDAVSRAYDVSLAADEVPEEFAELIADNGLAMQDRAPMTPVVKLVFGADYDKTRLTEYATVLGHARRLGVARGELARFLAGAEGGLKGVVQAERRMRREEEGRSVEPADAVRPALAGKLRQLELHGFDAIDPDGPEFGLVVIRRLGNGKIAVLGDCSDDIALVEKAARKLIG